MTPELEVIIGLILMGVAILFALIALVQIKYERWQDRKEATPQPEPCTLHGPTRKQES